MFNMKKHFAKTIKGKETKCSANNCGVEVHQTQKVIFGSCTSPNVKHMLEILHPTIWIYDAHSKCIHNHLPLECAICLHSSHSCIELASTLICVYRCNTAVFKSRPSNCSKDQKLMATTIPKWTYFNRTNNQYVSCRFYFHPLPVLSYALCLFPSFVHFLSLCLSVFLPSFLSLAVANFRFTEP